MSRRPAKVTQDELARVVSGLEERALWPDDAERYSHAQDTQTCENYNPKRTDPMTDTTLQERAGAGVSVIDDCDLDQLRIDLSCAETAADECMGVLAMARARITALESALRQCQSTLAILTNPANKDCSAQVAWAQCVEAETRARELLG